jgi:uncharacterized protein with PIN domain
MTYHIPSDEQLTTALKKVLKKSRTIPTQTKLKKLVLKNLNKGKIKYGVTGDRLRKLAILSNIAKIEIFSREGDPKKPLRACPVCNHSLKKVKNLTIWGGVVTIEFQCPKCGYWTGKKKRIPTRYIFHYKV